MQFDDYYGSPGEAPPAQADQHVPATAPTQPTEDEAAALDRQVEFAGLMEDIDQLPEIDPLPGDNDASSAEAAPLPELDPVPEDAPPAQVDQDLPPTAASQPSDAEVAVPDTQEEFTRLVGDIEQLPDAPLPDLDPLPEDAPLPTTQLEDPFTGIHPPATPSFLAPGPSATSIFQNEQPSYSPELPQEHFSSLPKIVPSHLSPDAPSSGNRSLMQAEMRLEEDLQSSPVPMTPVPLARSTLGASIRGADTKVSDTNLDAVAIHMCGTPNPQVNSDDEFPDVAKVGRASITFEDSADPLCSSHGASTIYHLSLPRTTRNSQQKTKKILLRQLFP